LYELRIPLKYTVRVALVDILVRVKKNRNPVTFKQNHKTWSNININKKAKMSFVRQNAQSFMKLRLEANCMNVIPKVVFLTAVLKTLLNILWHNLLKA